MVFKSIAGAICLSGSCSIRNDYLMNHIKESLLPYILAALSISIGISGTAHSDIIFDGSVIWASSVDLQQSGDVVFDHLPLNISPTHIQVYEPLAPNVTTVSPGFVTINDASGPINVTSGINFLSSTRVGSDGAGVLTLDGAGVTFTVIGGIDVGQRAGVATGIAPNLNTSYGDVLDPWEGKGEINILNGATLNTSTVYLGKESGIGYLDSITGVWSATPCSPCTAHNLTTEGAINLFSSTWTNTGSMYVGIDGAGVINIHAGANVSHAGDTALGFGAGSTGIMNFNGGVWTQTGDLRVGNNGSGTINFNDGQMSIGGNLLFSADSAGTNSVVNIDAGTWTVGGRVGLSGSTFGEAPADAVMNLRGNSTVFNHNGNESAIDVGYFRSGELNVETGATFNTNGDINLGLESGVGLLSIQNGGRVIASGGIQLGVTTEFSEFCDEFGCFPYPFFAGRGTVVVNGSASLLNVGYLNMAGTLSSITGFGDDSLTVSSGGTVISRGGISDGLGTTIDVTGTGSTLSSVGQNNFYGSVSISNGAQLSTNQISVLGTPTTSDVHGITTIDGPGSKWTAQAVATGSSLATTVPVIRVGLVNNPGNLDNNLIVSNGGTIEIVPAAGSVLDTPVLEIIENGTLSGNGTIIGDVLVSGGTVAPGLSPGTLTIDGNYTQEVGSALVIEIAGLNPGEFDVLNILGAAIFDPGTTIDLDFTNGFAPTTGDVFEFLLADIFASDMSLINFNVFGLETGFLFDTGFTDAGTFNMTALNDGASTIPVPAAVWLFGSGLLGLIGVAKRRAKA